MWFMYKCDLCINQKHFLNISINNDSMCTEYYAIQKHRNTTIPDGFNKYNNQMISNISKI